MARILSIEGETRTPLSSQWSYLIDESGAFATPDALPSAARWKSAIVPGSLAQTLIAEGMDIGSLPALDSLNVWYRTRFSNTRAADLIFHGLATLADIFIDGVHVLSNDNMFVAATVENIAPGAHELHIRFRSIEREIATKTGRARWRPRMIQPAGLRHIRTTALGRLPGFAPPTPPIGVYRTAELVEHGALRVASADLRSEVTGHEARLRVELETAQNFETARLFCGEHAAAFERIDATHIRAEIALSDCALWFPHTHGAPHLYRLHAEIDGQRVNLGMTGFRNIRVDRGADSGDFALHVNNVPVFCRGAVWTMPDVVSLPGTPEACAPLLEAMRDAGMNMTRVPGVTLYESPAFYALCDELGIMVWQDFAFANFDYPLDSPGFRESVSREAAQFLSRVQNSPALVAACGGSEVYQQASMLGLGEEKWRSPLFDDLLPGLTRAARPDIAYIENSPSGGALPFQSDFGVAHYYGVGAYRRPLEDARRANVRFASECLGFSNVPEDISLRRDFGQVSRSSPLSSPLWDARIPRDMGAQQTFGDVTEHYMRAFFGVDPAALRAEEPQRYLDLARASVAQAIEATIGEWRRVGSTTRGALVWFLKDMWPSAGWGLIDAHGEPKSAYHAMKRACRSVQVLLTDEGVNGVFVHLLNDGPEPLDAHVTLSCYRDGRVWVMHAARPAHVPPHGALMIRDAEFWGGFFDTALAYNFGAPSHDAVVAELRGADGALRADAFLFPGGGAAAADKIALRAEVARIGDAYALRLAADAVTSFVKIDDPAYRPSDNWLHLAPGVEKLILLTPREAGAAPPHGVVTSLDGARAVYG